jgi:hypothetical protein
MIMGEIEGLIERLEKATGPDREIDCHLWALDAGVELEWQGTTLVAGHHGVVGWADPGEHSRNFYTNRDVRGPGGIHAYTASLDAALALVERFRAQIGCYGWRIDFDDEPVADPYSATLGITHGFPSDVGGTWAACHKTAPLALCLALLKSMETEQ